jgi:acetylglutamate kinase
MLQMVATLRGIETFLIVKPGVESSEYRHNPIERAVANNWRRFWIHARQNRTAGPSLEGTVPGVGHENRLQPAPWRATGVFAGRTGVVFAVVANSIPPLSSAAETVLTFLESVGRRSESELYLRLFRTLPHESFAVIAVGANVVHHALDTLLGQLRFLADLGLHAPVVVGALESGSAAACCERLDQRLSGVGLSGARHRLDESDLLDQLREELGRGHIPVIDLSSNGVADLDRRFDRLGSLVASLQSRKLVVLRRRGGIGAALEGPLELAPGHALEVQRAGISVIDVRSDADLLLASYRLNREDAELLSRARRLLEKPAGAGLLVSVASPLDLLKELFTVKGAGTLIKLGSPIRRFGGFEGVDLRRLHALLEASFGKRLDPEFLSGSPLAAYLESGYRGAALLYEAPPAPYLSKFAVDPVAQGEGIGRDLWRAIVRDHPRFFWRSRPENPIAAFYTRVCDGMVRCPSWQVFWRGLEVSAVPGAVEYALSKPPDLSDP